MKMAKKNVFAYWIGLWVAAIVILIISAQM